MTERARRLGGDGQAQAAMSPTRTSVRWAGLRSESVLTRTTIWCVPSSLEKRMSRSPWNFSTAVPVSRLRGDERNGLLGGGGDGGLMELTLDRGDELGEVGVADDAPELSLGFEHPRGGPAQAHVARLPVLDVATGAPDALDHRLARVRALERLLQVVADPEAVRVSVSSRPSRSDAAAPGCERSSSPASRRSSSSARA